MAKQQVTLDEVQNYLKAIEAPAAWDIYTKADDSYEANIVRDMVSKVFKFRSLSDKQINFLKSLLKKIEDRPVIEAQKKAEWDAAKEVPAGRQTFKAKVLNIKETDFGSRLLLQHADGWKVYGSVPSTCHNPNRGDVIEMTATINVSDKDSKFGFYKRPTKAAIVERKDVFKIVSYRPDGTVREDKLATEVESKQLFQWACDEASKGVFTEVLRYVNGDMVDGWGT